MSSMLEDINHLSREIGARPRGTEEERLAAMYIAENIQKRSGLPFDIEDFEGAIGKNNVYNIIPIVSAVLLLVSILLPILQIPAVIISLLVAVYATLEIMEKPLFPNLGRNGISQNVVAKYVPSVSSDNQQIQRKRKVVIVSHYDSGRALPNGGTGFLKFKSIARYIAYTVDIIIPLFLIIKMMAFAETSGPLSLFCIIFSLILLLCSILPALCDFYENRLLYNEGANCNASGNAALIEIARQLGTGAYITDSEEKQPSKTYTPSISGIETAEKENVIPKGAKVNYEVPQDGQAENSQDPLADKERSLADAKAAVAAFMAPRAPRKQYDNEGNVVDQSVESSINPDATKPLDGEQKSQVSNITIDDASAARVGNDAGTTASIPAYKTETHKGDVPDWFKSAQSKAKKEEKEDVDDDRMVGQRSRFAHTMDVMAKRKEDEEREKQAKEEEQREKLRQQIIAANKAAEEERQKKFGDEAPFFRTEGEEQAIDVDKTQAMPPVEYIKEDSASTTQKVEVKEELEVKEDGVEIKENVEVVEEPKAKNNEQEMSIDERFKLHQQEKTAPEPVVEKAEVKQDEAAFDKSVVNVSAEEVKEENIVKDAFSSSQENKTEAITEEQSPKEQEKSPSVLPEHSGPIDLGEMKQYAPLDDQSFISSNDMPENASLIELPEVITGEQDIEKNPEYAKTLKETENIASTSEIERGKFGTGSFAAISESEGVAGATGTFAPVTEELIEDAHKSGNLGKKEDIIVDDADDSVYNEGEFTDTGAFAGKGYVDMPNEKRKGLFGLFSKKDKNEGKHAGSSDGFIASDKGDNIIDDDSQWEGGAFSGIGKKLSEMKPGKSNDNLVEDEAFEQAANQEAVNEQEVIKDENAPITSARRKISPMVDAVPDFDQQIQEFRNTSINLEVWMVALGAEINENAGMRAFLMEHSQELRGAIIIDIEALGSGNLSLVNSEGIIKKSTTATRLKRYIRQAANKAGIAIPSINLAWSSSSASYANKCGFKTIRLAGIEDGKPAYYMDSDDVTENIDPNVLQNNIKYLFELIQCI